MEKRNTIAIILAAGSGTRMKSTVTKQQMLLCGASLLKRSVAAFEKCPQVDGIIVVSKSEELDFAALGHIDLFAPKKENFPLLGLAYEVGRIGGSLPAVMNAANEVLVYKFLEKRISYKDIYRYVAKAVEDHANIASPTLDEILDAAESTKRSLAHI